MRAWAILILPSLLLTIVIIAARSAPTNRSRIAQWESRYNDARLGRVTPTQLLSEVGLRTDLIPAGTVGRKIFRPMEAALHHHPQHPKLQR